ncbi:MAG: hypothetical protein J5533_00335 [Bacteroidales bacterium]|nr:hypothetical protein [Bacteroidales bacterium]
MKRSLIIALVLLTSASCRTKSEIYEDILSGAKDAVCWMTPLPDDTPLNRMSIPGAHDAATATITSFTLWTKTQDLGIADLWNCGVRAFDLRPAFADGRMSVYHDKYNTNVSFVSVVNGLVAALNTHPGEAAIIIIRHEEEADGNDPQWSTEMDAFLQSLRSRLIPYQPDLTLGEMRGKILFLSRNDYRNGPLGGYIRGWTSSGDLSAQKSPKIEGEDGARHPLWVQDYYHPKNAEDKWQQVQGMFDATASASAPYPLVINHTSGYLNDLPDYRSNARNINAKAAEYIIQKGAPAGIVMMDFAGVDRSNGKEVGGLKLLQTVIKNN